MIIQKTKQQALAVPSCCRAAPAPGRGRARNPGRLNRLQSFGCDVHPPGRFRTPAGPAARHHYRKPWFPSLTAVTLGDQCSPRWALQAKLRLGEPPFRVIFGGSGWGDGVHHPSGLLSGLVAPGRGIDSWGTGEECNVAFKNAGYPRGTSATRGILGKLTTSSLVARMPSLRCRLSGEPDIGRLCSGQRSKPTDPISVLTTLIVSHAAWPR
jgi:hypothetical protein